MQNFIIIIIIVLILSIIILQKKNDVLAHRIALANRMQTYFSKLSADDLKSFLFADGMGAVSKPIFINDKTVFAKFIPLGNQELNVAETFSTANVYNLPNSFHYAHRYLGFNAWREVKTALAASQWVRNRECIYFPIVYGVFVIDHQPNRPNEIRLALECGLWDNLTITESIVSRRISTHSVVMIQEYVQWNQEVVLTPFGLPTKHDIRNLINVSNEYLQAITFLNSKGYYLFNGCFRIFRNSRNLYICNFSHVMSYSFDLSPAEIVFLNAHKDIDIDMYRKEIVKYALQYSSRYPLLQEAYTTGTISKPINNKYLREIVEKNFNSALRYYRFAVNFTNNKNITYH